MLDGDWSDYLIIFAHFTLGYNWALASLASSIIKRRNRPLSVKSRPHDCLNDVMLCAGIEINGNVRSGHTADENQDVRWDAVWYYSAWCAWPNASPLRKEVVKLRRSGGSWNDQSGGMRSIKREKTPICRPGPRNFLQKVVSKSYRAAAVSSRGGEAAIFTWGFYKVVIAGTYKRLSKMSYYRHLERNAHLL